MIRFLLVITFFLLSITSVVALDQYSCDSCEGCDSVISQAGSSDVNITLSSDIEATEGGICIDLSDSENISFNCAGHYIEGMDNLIYGHKGISLARAMDVTIKDCILRDFYRSIDATDSYSARFHMLDIQNSNIGLVLAGSEDAHVSESEVKDNVVDDILGMTCSSVISGLNLTGGPMVYLHNQSHLSGADISTLFLCGAHSSTITSVNISLGGLYVKESDSVHMENVTLRDVSNSEVHGSRNMTIRNLTVEDSTRYGLDIFNSSIMMEDLTLGPNPDGYGGIRITSSSDVFLSGSQIIGNSVGISLHGTDLGVRDNLLDNLVNHSMEDNSSMFSIECLHNHECERLDFCDADSACLAGFCQRSIGYDDGIDCTIATCYEDNESIVTEPHDYLCDDGDPSTEGICDVDAGMCVFEAIDPPDSDRPSRSSRPSRPPAPWDPEDNPPADHDDATDDIRRVFSHTTRSLRPDEEYDVDISDPDFPISSLRLRSSTGGDINLNITLLESIPEVPEEGSIFFFNISMLSDDGSLVEKVLRFRLDKEHDNKTITLKGFDDGWQSYDTRPYGSDDDFSYYEAEISAAQFYAVLGEENAYMVTEHLVDDINVSIDDHMPDDLSEMWRMPTISTILVAALVLAASVLSVAIILLFIGLRLKK